MRFNILLAVIGILLCLCVDGYIIFAIRQRAKRFSRLLVISFLISMILGACCLVTPWLIARTGSNEMFDLVMWMLFLFLSMFLAKLTFCIVDIIASIPKLFCAGRLKIVSKIGIVLAVGLFSAMWWGALINRYRISVTHTVIESPEVPQSFDGYTIAQISDLHVGTWGNDTTFLSHLVDRVNSLNPDVIVFTGDIVNRQSDEFVPMVSTFSRLHAPDGVYAILGNHDYGDYRQWKSDEEHYADVENLKYLYSLTGCKLLLNETVYLTHCNDSIALIGVENIGDPPFSVYGDLEAAYSDISDSLPKVLLSHNPAHWTAQIKNNPQANVLLTLSGHTHAMQIQIAGKSPSSLRYKTSWGLYTDSLGHSLYVNRGAGTVGMPMRLGATPEISIITLKHITHGQ